MKARLVLNPEEALLEPTAIMGDEEGIYLTFMSDEDDFFPMIKF